MADRGCWGQVANPVVACITGVYLAERETRDIEGEAQDTSAKRDARGREKDFDCSII